MQLSPKPLKSENTTTMPSVEDVRVFLRALVKDKTAHSHFLNMLSMLEHMGSRKIMLSQMRGDMNELTLKHLAEESRHAFFFKRQAERVAGAPLKGYSDENTYARAAARMYFDRLVAEVFHETGLDDAYPWTTRMVEIRATWFYQIYETVLHEQGLSLSLKSLLAEEEGHLEEMDKLCGDDKTRLHKLAAIEEKLFAKLWDVIAH